MALKYIATRHYVLLMGNLFMKGFSEPANFEHLLSLPNYMMGYATRVTLVYFDGEHMKELGSRMLEGEAREPGFIMKVFQHIYTHGERLEKHSQEIKQMKLSGKPPNALITIFKDFSEEYAQFSVTLATFVLETPIQAKLLEYLKDRKNPDEDLITLTFPKKKNIITIEKEDILRIAAEIQKAGITDFTKLPAKLKRAVELHAEKYGWINARGGIAQPWTAQDILDRIKELLKEDCAKQLEEAEQTWEEQQKISAALLEELKPDENLKRLVDIAKELVYLRTYRTDCINMTFVNIWPLLKEIARELGCSLEDLLYYRYDELFEGQRLGDAEIARRKKDRIQLVVEPHNMQFASEPAEIDKLVKKYLPPPEEIGKEVKGNVAFRGKATGRAVILHTVHDLPKVKSGDILVTTMTFPNFIPAMQRASAFVTDEGGITCHAAIVSREMKKPCIIGTKNATKVFKDGDMIEVDAEKGIVRKV